MRAGKLDRLFERFRRKGDVRALGEVFDAAAPELYRVAVHLTHDLHQAEDLVQSTFLAAIEARESYDAKRELLPWLLGILTRKSAWERRKRSRVIEPDRLEPRSTAEPSLEAESSELSASVTEAVGRLPSPYREVLIAHLRAGKSPQEIALELGRSPGTVRVQLHRGLEMLRKTLPVGLATGGALAAFSSRGLAAVRASVLRTAADQSISIAAGLAAAPATSLIGGIAVSVKAWIAVGLVVLGIAWLGLRELEWSASSPLPTEVVAAPTSEVLSVEPSSIQKHGAEFATTEPLPQRTSISFIPDERAAVDTSVSGRLLLPDGTPASGAFVTLLRRIEHAHRDSVADGTTTRDGSFLLRGSPGACYLVCLADGLLPITKEVVLIAGTELRLEPLSFSTAAHIRGWVKFAGIPDPTGFRVTASLGVQGIEFDLHQRRLLWSEERMYVKSATAEIDADGRFSIEGLESHLQHVTVEGPARRILGAAWEIQAPAEDAQLSVDYARVVVHVQCEGRPIEAEVSLQGRNVASSVTDARQRFTEFVEQATSHGRGGPTWSLGSGSTVEALVPPGASYLIRAEREGYQSNGAFGIVAPAAGDTVERTIELKHTQPLAELVITIATSDESKIDAAGFALFRTGQTSQDHGAINRSALSNLMFARAGPGGRRPDVVRDVHAVDGTFRLSDLPPGRYELGVKVDGTWDTGTGYWYHDPIEVELVPDVPAYRRVYFALGGRLRVQCSNARGAWLPANCRFIDPWGKEIQVGFFTQDDQGSSWLGSEGDGVATLNNSAPQGTNEVASNLPPGNYEVRFSLETYADASRTVTVEAGKTATVSVVLEDR